MTTIRLKRVYNSPEPSPGDGYRVFVDRLWPRGESKVNFHYDLWAKDIAPSAELREWYHADEANRWDEFRHRYLAELEASPEARQLRRSLQAKTTPVTLLYASRDTLNNNAVVLAEFLKMND